MSSEARKAKAPKPVKAWAIMNEESGMFEELARHRMTLLRTRQQARRSCFPGERVVRVLVTPLESKP